MAFGISALSTGRVGVCRPSDRRVTPRLRVALTPRRLPQAKEALQVAPELSAMVVYCQAVPFPGLAQALRHPRPCQVSSFSERKARKLIKEAGEGDGMGTWWLHAPVFTGVHNGVETNGLCHQGGSVGGVWGYGGLARLVALGSGARGQGEGHRVLGQGQSLGGGIWVLGQVLGLGLGLRSWSGFRD